MADMERLPVIIVKIQHSLEPFVKTRQESIGIRRAIGAHIGSHVQKHAEEPLCRPLSLVESSYGVGSSPHGAKGMSREYLRCVLANVNARTEYSRLCIELQVNADLNVEDSRIPAVEQTNKPTESFVDLARNREKHERLRIIQDYVDLMALKPAATPEYLDPKVVLSDLESLPRVPQDVMNGSGAHQNTASSDLEMLVEKLEKSVLRAKILLRREQRLLAKVKAVLSTTIASPRARLEALGSARNELINWIETELAAASETPEAENPTNFDQAGRSDIESDLISVQRRYLRYTKARQSLILTATMRIDTPFETKPDTVVTMVEVIETAQQSNNTPVLYPHLENIVRFSNEQRALIQQKSYLTVGLAKQLKESGQGLERLAGESHLLASHPISRSIPRGSGVPGQGTFGDTMSNHETPDSSRRAQAWVHATQSARSVTERIVSERIVEGDAALTTARESLLDLQHLLGTPGNGADLNGASSDNSAAGLIPQDVWATLDGNLGAIKDDEVVE